MADNPYAPPSAAESPSASGSTAPAPGMAQCSITKKWFPEDELVTFQGQLVSAEGKQILLDRLQTGTAAPGTLARPTVLRRLFCIFVDWLILVPGFLGISALVGRSVNFSSPDRSSAHLRRVSTALHVGGVLYLIFGAIVIAYFSIMHSWKGKTIGKGIGGLHVVNADGSPISWRRATARSFVFLGIMFPYYIAISTGIGNLMEITAYAVLAWIVADAAGGITDTRMQRTLHDRICGTRVIWLNA